MMLSDLAIRRPVLAIVASVLLMIFGVIALRTMSLRGYPDVDAPIVSVATNYPGASAAVVESKITEPLEDRLSGLDSLKNISSQSSEGRSRITLEFNAGHDIEAAANDVRSAVARARSKLPQDADEPDVTKSEADARPMIWISVSSTTLNPLELTDYLNRHVVDRFKSVDGVARVQLWGDREYAMRISLDRQALAARNLTASDVEAALRAENVELPAGLIESVDREFSVRVTRGYNNADDFSRMVIARGKDGHIIRLGEVARVELGPKEYRTDFRNDGANVVAVGIIRQSKANDIAVSDGVMAVYQQLRAELPDGMAMNVTFNSVVFLDGAIHEVYFTMAMAMLLVILVIYLFLGDWRATLIPAVTVPVSITAAFIVLKFAGFSVNMLTLLAGVLAIGLVVDDAIVVLENVYRRIEAGEPPLLAAFRGTREVGFAVIATTLVLVVVFAPIIFMGGNAGRMFAEFSLMMASSVLFSGFVALTLCAMMCSRLLRAGTQRSAVSRWVDRGFQRVERSYTAGVGVMIQRPWLGVLLLVMALVLIGVYWRMLPRDFDPGEDRGAFSLVLQGPEGASFEYTRGLMRQVEERLQPLVGGPNIRSTLLHVPGNDPNAHNTALGIIVLQPWAQRKTDAWQIMREVQAKVADIPGAQIYTVMRKPLAADGTQPLEFVIGGDSYEELAEWRDKMMTKVRANPGIISPQVDFKENRPQLHLKIDRDRAADIGVSLGNISKAMETLLSERDVTTFYVNGREYDVVLLGDEQQFRSRDDMRNVYVRSERTGELVSLSNLVEVSDIAGPPSLNRYNRVRSFTISAGLAPGYPINQALDFMHSTVRDTLPASARIGYKGLTQEFVNSGSSGLFVFAIALVIIYLVLAAQFESFIYPLVILFTVPFALLGAMAGLSIAGQSLNIYSQVGMVMLVGLSAKNGILIVEFANQLRDRGVEFTVALTTAATQRLRPIVMTSATAIIGALPLIFSAEPGARSRLLIGIVVFGGVLATTLFTVFVVPAAYTLLGRRAGTPGTAQRALQAFEDAGM